MILAEGQKFRNTLAAREPENTNAPGLKGNKNGPPGPAGNQKGPPSAASTTGGLTTSTSQISLETGVSSSDDPPPSTASSTPSPTTSSALITTSTSKVSPGLPSSSITLTSITLTPSTNFKTSFVPSTTSGESLTKFDVSTSSATALQTGIVYYTPNNTAQTEHSAAAERGQKAGVAVGTIAGFAFILTLIFLLFKWHRGELPKTLPCLARRVLGKGGNSRWLAHNQTPDAMSDSLLTTEVGVRGSLAWDYRETFAQPTAMEKMRRSLPKSLRRLVRFNPLGLNPVSPQDTGAGTPSRNSFASFFHRRSAATTYRSDSYPSNFQGQSGIVSDPHAPPSLPPPPYRCPPLRTPVVSSPPREFVQSSTDDNLRPRTMPPQVPPPAFQRPWYHRNSHTTLASDESEARSFKSAPGRAKFQYPHTWHKDRGVAWESWKAFPPLAISPSSWLKAKPLRRPHSTSTFEDNKGRHMASDNGNESMGAEHAVIGLSGRKEVQTGYGNSGASSESLVGEKQEL